MALYVDSADPRQVATVAALGLVEGVTTNPALVARAGGDAAELIPALAALVPGLVFYQLCAPTLEGRIEEAERALGWAPDRVGLKIAATTENMALVDRFSALHPVAVTAIFAPHQVAMAAFAGARWVIPYVNRSSRLLGDGIALVRQFRATADAAGTGTEILAASLKSPIEAAEALCAGAQHLSLPPDVLLAMGDHPLSQAAIDEFARALTG